MFKHVSLLTLSILLCNAVHEVVAQEWQTFSKITNAVAGGTSAEGTGRAVLFDTCSSRLWACAGSRLYVVDESGRSIRPIPMPTGDGVFTGLQLHALGCNIGINYTNRIGEEQLALWRETSRTWDIVSPVRSVLASVASGVASVCLYSDAQNGKTYALNLNAGNWMDLDSLAGERIGVAQSVQPGSGNSYTFSTSAKKDKWYVYETDINAVRLVETMASTKSLVRVPGDKILAYIVGTSSNTEDAPRLLYQSVAQPSTWTVLDSIVCTNGGLSFTAKDSGSPMAVESIVVNRNSVYISFRNGVTIVSSDSLKSFQHVTTRPCNLREGTSRYLIVESVGSLVTISCDGGLSRLIATAEGGSVESLSSSIGLRAIAYNGRFFVGVTKNGIVVSANGSKWWVVQPPDSIIDESARPDIGYHRVHADRIAATATGEIIAGVINGGQVLRVGSNNNIELLGQNSLFERNGIPNVLYLASIQCPFLWLSDSSVSGMSFSSIVHMSLPASEVKSITRLTSRN